MKAVDDDDRKIRVRLFPRLEECIETNVREVRWEHEEGSVLERLERRVLRAWVEAERIAVE